MVKFAACVEYFLCRVQRAEFIFRKLKISYLEWGHQNESKLVIAHANGYAAGCYSYIAEALANRYHVCALDFAGHGESEGTLDFSSWDFFSDQIMAFLEYKKWPRSSAIGHSLGGGSLLRAAQIDASRFEKIIAFDPVMLSFGVVTYVKLFGNPMAQVARSRRATFKSKSHALKILERHPGQKYWDTQSVKDYVEYCISENNTGARLKCDPQIEAQIFSQANYGHLFKLGQIRCETHLVFPAKSKVCARWVARKIVINNSTSSQQYLAGTGHLLPFEDRELTLHKINAVL